MKKPTDFNEHLEKLLKKKGMRKYYEEYGRKLEIAYRVAELRAQAEISQSELAKRIGTKQSNIARIESGEQNFTIGMLDKIAQAFGKELQVKFA